MFGLKRLKRRFQLMALIAITGGFGAGGYAYRDEPFVRGLIALVREQAGRADPPGRVPTAEGLLDEAEAAVGRAVRGLGGAGDPGGAFEVAIGEVRLDGREFHAGHPVMLEARVVRRDADGGEGTVVWSSGDDPKHATHPVIAGPEPIAAGWAGAPFRLDVRPGDRLGVEVWDLTRARSIRCYTLDLDSPPRTRTYTLTTRADGERTLSPSANTVAITARRVGDAPAPAPAPAVAEGRPAHRDARR